jgi:hypothetical protein
MGKSYLTREELSAVFPTLEELSVLCGSHVPSKWGLITDGQCTTFGPASEGWCLVVSFTRILKSTMELCLSSPRGDIFVLYGVDTQTDKVTCMYALVPPEENYQPGPVVESAVESPPFPH